MTDDEGCHMEEKPFPPSINILHKVAPLWEYNIKARDRVFSFIIDYTDCWNVGLSIMDITDCWPKHNQYNYCWPDPNRLYRLESISTPMKLSLPKP